MRKDAVGAYGGPVSTPNLDSFSKDSVLYKNCVTPAPWTFPAHVSFFIGQYASEHGLHETYELKGKELWHRNDMGSESIVEFLKKIGYNTVGISGNPWLYPGTIFAKGFSFFACEGKKYRLSGSEKETVARARKYGKNAQEIVWHLASHGRIRELFGLYSTYRNIKNKERQGNYPLVKGGDKITGLLKDSSFEEPFFLFLNFMEMHDPYTRYELDLTRNMSGEQPGLSMADLLGLTRIQPAAMSEIRKQYFVESSCADSFFGQLLTEFKKKNLYDDSLIIVTSDHGQALKERNYYGHSIFLYDEIIEVPLIVKYPQNKGPPVMQGYQSLVYIPRLIKNVVQNDFTDALTEPVVFSESFGIPQQTIRNVPEDLRKRFDLPRKAVYKDGYKMTVNWMNMEVEDLSYKGKSLNAQDKKMLCDSLLDEFSVLKSSGKINVSQPPSFSPEEESEINERLRNLGYA